MGWSGQAMVSFDWAIEPSQGRGTAAPSLSAAFPARSLFSGFRARWLHNPSSRSRVLSRNRHRLNYFLFGTFVIFRKCLAPEIQTKLLKPIKQFPSTNKPIKCPICSDVGVKPTNVFIPKYNMLEHYKQVHDIDYEQEPLEELENHVISDEEVKKVSGKFPIRKTEVSGARCGA